MHWHLIKGGNGLNKAHIVGRHTSAKAGIENINYCHVFALVLQATPLCCRHEHTDHWMGLGARVVFQSKDVYIHLSQMVQLQAVETTALQSSPFQLSFITELVQDPHAETR